MAFEPQHEVDCAMAPSDGLRVLAECPSSTAAEPWTLVLWIVGLVLVLAAAAFAVWRLVSRRRSEGP